MLGAVAAIAKFSHGREWTLKYPSEIMRRFCGKISNPFWEKGDNLLDIHRFAAPLLNIKAACSFEISVMRVTEKNPTSSHPIYF